MSALLILTMNSITYELNNMETFKVNGMLLREQ